MSGDDRGPVSVARDETHYAGSAFRDCRGLCGAFGQKEFDELSPRTLARYLELYLDDSAKRRRMLELSRGEVITRPDSQVFYEMNMKLLRALYGEEAIDEVRKKELDIR